MVGTILCSSPRESMSSISRVQTVLSIDSSLGEIEKPVTDNFNKLQGELKLLQAKLNDVSGDFVKYFDSLEIFEFCLLFRWRNLELHTRRQTNNCCLSSTNFLLNCQGMSRSHKTRQSQGRELNKLITRLHQTPPTPGCPPPSGDRKVSG